MRQCLLGRYAADVTMCPADQPDCLRRCRLSSPVSVINHRGDLYSAARPSRRKCLITIWCDTEYLVCALASASRGSVSGSGDSRYSAEYWIYSTGQFGGVHAFGYIYNSSESEPIWMKSGALWIQTDFGRDLRSSDRQPKFFCLVNNARFRRRQNFTKFQHKKVDRWDG